MFNQCFWGIFYYQKEGIERHKLFKRKIEVQRDEYLAYCERFMSISSMRSKRWVIRKFVNEVGVSDINQVTIKHLDTWRFSQLDAGISPGTVNTRTHHVRAFLKYLRAANIDTNHIKDIPKEKRDVLFFESDTIRKVLQHCQGHRDYLLISICFESGLRLTEVAKLKVEDIDGNKIVVTGKGNVRSPTFIREETRIVLGKWLALNDISRGYVFPSATEWDKHLSTDQVRYIMKKAFKRVGIENFHPHALRHSTATTLVKNGADISYIQRLMRHSDPKITSRYIHLLAKDLKEAHEKYFL